MALHALGVPEGEGCYPARKKQSDSREPALPFRSLRRVSDADREKKVAWRWRGESSPKSLKRAADVLRSAKRFRLSSNFLATNLSSLLIPRVSLLPAPRIP